MTRAEWTRFGERTRRRCRAASGTMTALSAALLIDCVAFAPLAWHWWALLSAYMLSHAAYWWSDEQFWKVARLEARRMRRVVERNFPEDLEEFDRWFPDATA